MIDCSILRCACLHGKPVHIFTEVYNISGEKNARIMGITPEKSIRIKGLKVEEIKPVLPKSTINDNDEENS